MKFVFATGGTAGHINPALAVAGAIKEKYPDSEILFIGTNDHLEARLVPNAGFDFKTIDISGFQRKISAENIKKNFSTVVKMFKSSAQAKKILLDFKPDVAIGFGGYVSGPVIRQCVKLKIKTAIHEQNAFPGVANKTLAKSVDKVMVAVEDAVKLIKAKNGCIVTGLPVRGEVAKYSREKARQELKLDDKPLILSFGGSLGARPLNEAMVEVIAKKCPENDCYFIHAMGQYGLWMPEKLAQKGINISEYENLNVREYIDDMAKCLAAADLVICRAGASTLSELQVKSKASILIPSPYVAENHQYHNAMALVNKDAAIIMEEKDLSADNLIKTINSLLENKSRLKEIGDNAGAMAINNSVDRICDVIFGLIK